MTPLLETIDLRLRAALCEILAPEWVDQVAERLQGELRQPLEEATAAFIGISAASPHHERASQLRRGGAGRAGRLPGRPKRAELGAGSAHSEEAGARTHDGQSGSHTASAPPKARSADGISAEQEAVANDGAAQLLDDRLEAVAEH